VVGCPRGRPIRGLKSLSEIILETSKRRNVPRFWQQDLWVDARYHFQRFQLIQYIEYRCRLICNGRPESKFSAKYKNTADRSWGTPLEIVRKEKRRRLVLQSLGTRMLWCCCLPRPPHGADLLETCQLKGISLTVKFPERQRLENKRPWERSSGEEICQHRARKGRSVTNLLTKRLTRIGLRPIFLGWRIKAVKHGHCAGHLGPPVSIPASNGLAGCVQIS
jgi:hypothetical protein